MFQSKKDYLPLNSHANLRISGHLALITRDATYVVNVSMTSPEIRLEDCCVFNRLNL